VTSVTGKTVRLLIWETRNTYHRVQPVKRVQAVASFLRVVLFSVRVVTLFVFPLRPEPVSANDSFTKRIGFGAVPRAAGSPQKVPVLKRGDYALVMNDQPAVNHDSPRLERHHSVDVVHQPARRACAPLA
jgi:hypothetical protein|tara:strand:+ start:691 stop:1080 length:390 start_codon:yes stop_codon:yes gene_type:complete